MKSRNKFFAIALLSVALVGCSVNTFILLTDAIVTAAEGVLAVYPNVPPQVSTYLSGSATIVENLVACGKTPVCISTAVTQLGALVAPNISDPKLAALVGVVTKAVQDFIKAFAAPTTARMNPKGVELSNGDKAKLYDIGTRATALKAKLKNGSAEKR